MLSDEAAELLDFAIDSGFDESFVFDLLDEYVGLYADGDDEAINQNIDFHKQQFMEYLLASSEGQAEPSSFLVDNQSKLDPVEEDEDAEKDLPTEEHFDLMQENAKAAATPSENKMSDLQFALWKVFGIKSFRENQEEIVNAVLSGHDTFVLMHTGGGKSLCYQLPAILSRGLTVVISPLLSLIQDQVRSLVTLPCGGVPTACLSSAQVLEERKAVYREISKDDLTCKLLYCTPEQLTSNPCLIDILKRQQNRDNLARLVIDEAHCVSTWGHDFRPAYLEIGKTKMRHFPGLQIVAVTATAKNLVKNDVLDSLSMREPISQFQSTFYRSNLKLIVISKGSFLKGLKMLEKFIKSKRRWDSGIIYCLSKKECEEVSEILNILNIKAAHYHAGMPKQDREEIQNNWKSGKITVVVATIAFGMGIDNAHVRYVVHFVLPKSLENYYQEAGRAGRDGLRSECILFYSGKDVSRLKMLIRKGQTDYKQGNPLKI